MPMPEIERAVEWMPEVRDLQKRVRELEAFARWVIAVSDSSYQNLAVNRMGDEARKVLNKGESRR